MTVPMKFKINSINNMTHKGQICVILLLHLYSGIAALQECPAHCVCKEYTSMECYGALPDFIPASVRKVTAYEVLIHQGLEFYEDGWENVTHLFINPGLSVFHKKWEPEVILQNNTFIRLGNLQHLQFACKSLSQIQAGAFKGLTKLRVMDLSNNIDLIMDLVVQSFKQPNLPNLAELNLSNCSVQNRHVFHLGKEFYDIIKDKPLKVFDISNTGNAWLATKPELLFAFPHLEKLNISGAGLVLTSLPMPFVNPAPNASFKHLKILDISYPAVSTNWADKIFKAIYYGNIYIYIPYQLTEVYASKFFNSPVHMYGMSNSTHVCLQPTKESITNICLIGPFDNIKKISVSENSLEYVDPNMMRPAKMLQDLDISKNRLGKAFSEGDYAVSVLEILSSLEVLFISENEIFFIPEHSFRSSKLLRILDLSKNNLESITFRTDYLQSLEKFDLRYNNIKFLDTIGLNRLTYVANKLTNFNLSSNIETNLLLTGNPFVCLCESIEFLKWLSGFNTTFTCEMNSEDVTIANYSIRRAEYMCEEKLVIIVFSILGFMEVFLIALLAYFICLEIRLWKQRIKVKKGIENYAHNRNRDKVPPVFLSFCSEDEEFVMENVFPHLNDGLKQILKTESRCVAIGGMDFHPGFPLANEIIRCIEASSVVILFITNAFCRKNWCRNEAMAAHTDNKQLILMMFEKVDVKRLPKHLYKYYMQYTRVHWMQEHGEYVMKPDWAELCASVVKLMGENELGEETEEEL